MERSVKITRIKSKHIKSSRIIDKPIKYYLQGTFRCKYCVSFSIDINHRKDLFVVLKVIGLITSFGLKRGKKKH